MTVPAPPVDALSDDKTLTRRKTFFGHPVGLRYLVGLEAFDQFSFYGIQSTVLIYLMFTTAQGGLGISQALAVGIFGAFSGAIYLASMPASWISDRLVGAEKMLLIGAVSIVIGNFALVALPGVGGVAVGLAFIAFGGGAVKSTSSPIIGSMYAAADTRRDAGFSIYYMVARLGGLIGPIIVGLVQSSFGFTSGFLVAGFGMVLGFLIYLSGRRTLPESAHQVPNPVRGAALTRALLSIALFIALVVVGAAVGIISLENAGLWITAIAAVSIIAIFIGLLRDRRTEAAQRRRVAAVIPTTIIMILFGAAFVLQFTLLTVFADQKVDRRVGDWEFPVAWAVASIPFFVIVFTPFVAMLWSKLGTRQPPTVVKIGIGVAAMGLAMVAYLLMDGYPDGQAPLYALLIVGACVGLAEMLVIPLVLSLGTQLAPPNQTARTIAAIVLSAAVGSPLAGILLSFYVPGSGGPFFIGLGVAFIVTSALYVATSRWLGVTKPAAG